MRNWSIVSSVANSRLLKYEALGNDFLVSLEGHGLGGPVAPDEGDGLSAGFVAAVCDRRHGVGADGMIAARLAGEGEGRDVDVVMELRNADGGRAETSGNGLRCLALALVDEGVLAGPDVRVATDAGPRLVSLLERLDAATAMLRAGMGRLAVGAAEPAPGMSPEWHGRHVLAGNPHLVLIGPSIADIDIGRIGPALEQAVPGGQNVEVIAPADDGALDLVVWERGAGATFACGSGSCAAAAAARAARLSGRRVEVRNPGGTLVVELDGPDLGPEAYLIGPASRVCSVEVSMSLRGTLV